MATRKKIVKKKIPKKIIKSKKVQPKIIRKKTRKPTNHTDWTSHRDPLNIVLHLIGLIVIIYGAWFHELLWIILGFIPPIIGHWWEYIKGK